MGLVIRTIGRARAEAAVTLANMSYNMKRWCWLDRRGAPHDATAGTEAALKVARTPKTPGLLNQDIDLPDPAR
ncbi:MAG: hypothetical protein M3453_02450 [Pseudomonadota bacterium]|nr:hypothetical protein [Pseudomonadota bacterium]